MTRIRSLRAAMLVLAVVAIGCQDSRVVSPTAASLFVPNIAGVWSGPMTLVSASGGECVGAVIPTFLPSSDLGTVTIGEDGGSVTATMTTESTGLACRFSGNKTDNLLTMNATSCDRTGLIVACANGQTRQLRLVGSSLTATWDGQQITGRTTSTYNVLTPPGTEEIGVGSLVASHSFSATRR
jgi:hypothetical protein